MKALIFRPQCDSEPEEFLGVFSSDEIAIRSYLEYKDKESKRYNFTDSYSVEKLRDKYVVSCHLTPNQSYVYGSLVIEDIKLDEIY